MPLLSRFLPPLLSHIFFHRSSSLLISSSVSLLFFFFLSLRYIQTGDIPAELRLPDYRGPDQIAGAPGDRRELLLSVLCPLTLHDLPSLSFSLIRSLWYIVLRLQGSEHCCNQLARGVCSQGWNSVAATTSTRVCVHRSAKNRPAFSIFVFFSSLSLSLSLSLLFFLGFFY